MNKLISTIIFLVSVAISMSAFADKARTDVAKSANWHKKVDSTLLANARKAGEVEFLIYMDSQADVSAAKSMRTKEAKGQYVYNRLSSHAKASQAGVIKALGGAKYEAFYIVNVIVATGDLTLIQTLAEREDIAHIYAVGYGQVPAPVAVDEKIVGPSRGNDLNIEDNIEQVRAPEAWALGATGQGVVVGSADTGVNWNHETLKTKYRGWNAIDQVATHDYNWYVGGDPNPVVCPNELFEPCDDDVFLAGGHGTHTTATMVGSAAGGLNQVGMAPDAEWVACRNLDSGIGHVRLICVAWNSCSRRPT